MISPKDKLATCNEDTSTIIVNMEKEFKTVASVLKVDTLASQDGSVTLTADQMQAIEDRLNELESQHSDDANTIAERDNTINTLEQQVKNLQAAPADETGKVDEASADNNPMTSTEMYNFIKDLI